VVLDQTRELNIDGEKVQVNPQLLFQRLLTIGKARTDEYDIHQLLQYELPQAHQCCLMNMDY